MIGIQFVKQKELNINMFPRHPNRGTFRTQFECTSCGHVFIRWLPLIFVDGPTMLKGKIEKKDTYNRKYIIPQRISCPECAVIDKYILTARAINFLTIDKTVSWLTAGKDRSRPVKYIQYEYPAGQTIHPLLGLERLRELITVTPAKPILHRQYASLLRCLGYFKPAMDEYHWLLDHDDDRLEPLISLTTMLVLQNEKKTAKKYLEEFLNVANKHEKLTQKELAWVNAAQQAYQWSPTLKSLTPQALFGIAPLYFFHPLYQV